MQVITAVAEFEHDLLLERTHSGITRAKEAGDLELNPTDDPLGKRIYIS